jgi:hypothetical protein
MTGREKLDALIELADRLAVAIKEFINKAAAVLQSERHTLSVRDHVLVAIELKILSAFRALVDDARETRIETLHHLKTIVEAFIYLHVIGKDQTDATAKRMLRTVCEQKARFFRLNPEYAASGVDSAAWGRAAAEFKTADVTPLKDLAKEAAAHSAETHKWYDAIYRAACEPAHMADLYEFLPDRSLVDVKPGEVRTGLLHAIVAMDQGLQVMVGAVRFASDNQFNLILNVSEIETQLNNIRGVRTSDPQ